MNQPPYGPEDLKEPPMKGKDFLAFLHEERSRKYPEPPPLFQELFAGTLSRESLALWVKNQYAYWDEDLRFSTGAIFSVTVPATIIRSDCRGVAR